MKKIKVKLKKSRSKEYELWFADADDPPMHVVGGTEFEVKMHASDDIAHRLGSDDFAITWKTERSI